MIRYGLILALAITAIAALGTQPHDVEAAQGYQHVTIHAGPTPDARYVVFHSADSDGTCDGATSDHVAAVGYFFDAGPALIADTSSGVGVISPSQEFAQGVATFSTAANTSVLEFPFAPVAHPNQSDECQAWVLTSNPTLGLSNIVVVSEAADGTDTFFDIVFYKQPTLTTEGPIVIDAGKPHFHLVLEGTGFGAAPQAFVDGRPLRAWGRETKMHVQIPGELIAEPGVFTLDVMNGGPGGGVPLSIRVVVECSSRVC